MHVAQEGQIVHRLIQNGIMGLSIESVEWVEADNADFAIASGRVVVQDGQTDSIEGTDFQDADLLASDAFGDQLAGDGVLDRRGKTADAVTFDLEGLCTEIVNIARLES
ncbi:MAG: hypothetical protein AW07_04605 [Candidatus Accumulibacter sp. SK-11]|nr:MAG: hypothetical protein AW07_04605 [Candidatus Accumulibacter sp. SK-11]